MQQYYDAIKKKQHDEASAAARGAAASAAAWGGLYGTIDSLIYGGNSLRGSLLRGLGAAAFSAPVAAGSTLLGEKLLGPADEDETSPYAVRGGIGGGVGGATVGSGMGYLLGSGRLRSLAKVPGAPRLGAAAEKVLPLKNIIVDYIKRQASHPSHEGGLKTALLLGGLGAGYGALMGSSEGLSTDALRNAGALDEGDNARKLASADGDFRDRRHPR